MPILSDTKLCGQLHMHWLQGYHQQGVVQLGDSNYSEFWLASGSICTWNWTTGSISRMAMTILLGWGFPRLDLLPTVEGCPDGINGCVFMTRWAFKLDDIGCNSRDTQCMNKYLSNFNPDICKQLRLYGVRWSSGQLCCNSTTLTQSWDWCWWLRQFWI